MGSFSIWHWLVVLIFVGVFVVPLWKIVSKTGHPASYRCCSSYLSRT